MTPNGKWWRSTMMKLIRFIKHRIDEGHPHRARAYHQVVRFKLLHCDVLIVPGVSVAKTLRRGQNIYIDLRRHLERIDAIEV